MAILHLEALPPQTTKGTIVRLLTQVGELDKQKIGAIEVRGRAATIEVPDSFAARLVKALDGASLASQHIRARCEQAATAGEREDHFQRLARLLDIEAEAEAQQMLQTRRRLSGAEAEAAGTTLLDLAVRDEHAGLGGRVLTTFGKASRSPLPWTRLGTGSPVLVSAQDGADRWRGVVSFRDAQTIEVALAQPVSADERGATFRLDLSHDEISRQRQRVALERARVASGDRLAQLRRVLLDEVAPAFDPPRTPIVPLNPSLNASQAAAVRLAMSARDMALIHGPPGTGKTTTVIEVIRQAVVRGEKVLACAPSNLAVDNVFERLLGAGSRAIRLGHPARVLPELRAHTLDLMVEAHDDMRLAKKLTREAYTLFDRANRFTRAKPAPGEKNEWREEARRLLDDARRLERQVVQHVLNQADVLCATLTSLDSEILGQRTFDLAVIDEAFQTTEPSCWIPLLRSQRVVLAGDHCQLPPTVVSPLAEREGFGVSLFERLMGQLETTASQRLIEQYRMHESIMTFSSREFYAGELVADEAVREHLLYELPGVEMNELTSVPVTFIDTAGAGYDEELEPDGESRRNPSEAELVAKKVRAVLASGVTPRDMAVIAPYSAQVRWLRELLAGTGVEIDTVDGFQGREKEAVVISLVRSNTRQEIGFLADTRRMNVALTRARRKLIVVGDSATIGSHAFYQRMLEYFESSGAYHTVWEESE